MMMIFPDKHSKAKKLKSVKTQKFDHDERQLRCNKCENCMAKDCGGGIFCKEMFKFGGKIDQDEKKFENPEEETCAYCNRYV